MGNWMTPYISQVDPQALQKKKSFRPGMSSRWAKYCMADSLHDGHP
jgi:hypothetical protein